MFAHPFPDTDFMIDKELMETKGNLDIDEIWDNWDGTAQELANLLGISVSTANNWISSKEDISKMAKQALGFERLKWLISRLFDRPEKVFIVKKDDCYEVYQKQNNFYEKIAITKYAETARLIEKEASLIKSLKWAINFINEELKIRDSSDAQAYYKDFYNLLDCVFYIKTEETYSEKHQKIIDELDLTTKEEVPSHEPSPFNNIDSLKGAIFRYISNTTKNLYKKYEGCVLSVKMEKENSYRVLPVKKNGEIWLDFKDFQGNNSVGQVFPTLNAAMSSVYYTRTKSINVWRECEYSVDDGKTWHPAAELQDILK